MSNKVVFYCDIDSTSGLGHIARCKTISKIFRKKGFYSYLIVEKINQEITKSRFQKYFDSIYEKDTFVSLKLKNLILFVDSYNLSINDELLNAGWEKIVVIRDIETPKYEANFYLNQFVGSNHELENFQTEVFCPIVDPIYYQIGAARIEKDLGEVKQILVFGGGGQSSNFVPNIYSKLKLIDKSFSCILLTNNSIKVSDERFSVQKLKLNFHRLLKDSDTVISTAGSVLWELLAAKCIIGVAMEASNQFQNYQFVLKNTLGLKIGEKNNDLWEIDLKTINTLFFEPQTRKNLSHSTNFNSELINSKKLVEVIDKLI
jgi:spore coat polysaccharide biosynthesis predicted glycosyltransferase SpsG